MLRLPQLCARHRFNCGKLTALMTNNDQTETGWIEILVHVPFGWGELVAETLSNGPCRSAVIGNTADLAEPPAGREWVRSALALAEDSPAARSEITRALSELAHLTEIEELADLEPEFRQIPDEDWAGAWRLSWRPFRVGKLCVVTPDWTGQPRPGEQRLALVPGGTFGTGRHATTRTCMALIQERVHAGDTVLDVGTGTGILAVTATLFGASRATGFDIDPASRPAARDLARDNGVFDQCEFRQGGFEVLGHEDTNFDVLVANLYSDLIQRHAPELEARLKPGGWFAVSGCPSHHLEATRNALNLAGLPVAEVHTRGRWNTLEGHKRK
ncbi:MAG: ribosomal protein L11 methyltransferase [Planctomycetota bacterium]|jgi:ribosomal protein L11 methyltransferase